MSTSIQMPSEATFTIVKTNDKTGAVADAVTIQCSKVLDAKATGQIIAQTIKSAGSRRDAWLSLLSMVFADTRLDGFKGQGDRSTGKVSKEFKTAVRDAEGRTIAALVESGAIKLPKGEPETVLQTFLSEMRDDKNYSNVKVTANRYFAMVGANVVTPSGYLVPVEVMKEQIAEVVEKEETDNSVSAKLKGIEAFMADTTIDAADAIDSFAAVKRLYATLEGIVNKYAELATAGRSGVDVAANAAIEKAATNGNPIGTRVRVPAKQVEAANS